MSRLCMTHAHTGRILLPSTTNTSLLLRRSVFDTATVMLLPTISLWVVEYLAIDAPAARDTALVQQTAAVRRCILTLSSLGGFFFKVYPSLKG